MKTLVTFLVILMTFIANSQVTKYKLYSKIWFIQKSDRNGLSLNPKNGTGFDFTKTDSIRNLIDSNKVKKYLYESFNEFRHDYGKSSVKFSDSLSKQCEKYSRTLSKKYEHADFIGHNSAECINSMLLCLFSTVKKSDGDINKIVADCVFDSFAISNNHMDILLSDNYNKYGVGLTFTKYRIHIVIRGSMLK
jgi:uncharacterized protein YkwD